MRSPIKRRCGRGGNSHSFCAVYSLKMSVCSVPPRCRRATPCRSAAAREHAKIQAAGPLIVIDTVTSSSGMPANKVSVSSRPATATPHRPTSPMLRGSSGSSPISVGMSNATESPVCPRSRSTRNRSFVSAGVPYPANCRIVHRRPRYIEAYGPRVNGNDPGGASGVRSPGSYTASTGTPDLVACDRPSLSTIRTSVARLPRREATDQFVDGGVWVHGAIAKAGTDVVAVGERRLDGCGETLRGERPHLVDDSALAVGRERAGGREPPLMTPDLGPQLVDPTAVRRRRRQDRRVPRPRGAEVQHLAKLALDVRGAIAIRLVDDEEVRDLEDAGLRHLDRI